MRKELLIQPKLNNRKTVREALTDVLPTSLKNRLASVHKENSLHVYPVLQNQKDGQRVGPRRGQSFTLPLQPPSVPYIMLTQDCKSYMSYQERQWSFWQLCLKWRNEN